MSHIFRSVRDVSVQEVELYLAVAHAISEDYLDPSYSVQTMQELLDVKYLWMDHEENDELEWEEETPKGYEQKAFVSYYYFSYILLQEAVPIFAAVIAHNKETADHLAELLTLLQQLDK